MELRKESSERRKKSHHLLKLGGVEFSSNQRLSQVLPALLQNEIEEDELGIFKRTKRVDHKKTQAKPKKYYSKNNDKKNLSKAGKLLSRNFVQKNALE